jgi:hypothetical protein
MPALDVEPTAPPTTSSVDPEGSLEKVTEFLSNEPAVEQSSSIDESRALASILAETP